MKRKKDVLFFCVLSIVSLSIGGFIYLLYRESSYLSVYLKFYIDPNNFPDFLKRFDSIFIKFYFVDFLWAFSLSCGLHCIFMPKKSGTFVITGVVFLYGTLYEVLQLCSIIGGTGDFLDIMLYALAGIIVNIINLQRRKLK